MPSKIYVHHGDTLAQYYQRLEEGFLQDVDLNDRHICKPTKCFWGSPMRSKLSWEGWCRDNNFREGNYLDNKMTFRVPIQRIATIDSRLSFLYYYHKYGLGFGYDPSKFTEEKKWNPGKCCENAWLDFDKMRNDGHYGFEVIISKWRPLYWFFYGYDVDSIVIWDERGIIPTRRQPVA